MMLDLQTVFQTHYADYAARHPVSYEQDKAAQAIIGCRTKAYGGRVEQCPECDHTHVLYNSCRSRYCPKCQALSQARWVDARREDLLDVPYFHLVFTLPEELEVLTLQNPKTLYGFLFAAMSETLTQLAADPKWLGVRLGFTSILHTWGQNLLLHPHLHVIVPNGGLTSLGLFKKGASDFFLPVRVISKVFRGKFLAKLQQAFSSGDLQFHGSIAHLKRIGNFSTLRHTLYEKDWVVYAQEAYSGPEAVIQYLGRYTHRIAISDQRILAMSEETVTFRWRDYRDNQTKVMTLSIDEFIRRILLHVLPCRFMRIRHYGLNANRNRNTILRICQRLAGSLKSKSLFKGLTTVQILKTLLGKDVTLCPCCQQGTMQVRLRAFRSRASPPRSA